MAVSNDDKRQQFLKSLKVDQKTQNKLNQVSKKAQFNSNNSSNSNSSNKGEARQRERSRGMER